MSPYAPHTAETAPEASRAGLDRAARKFGRLPNLTAVMAESPAAMDGYLALHEIFEQSAFSPGPRMEMARPGELDSGPAPRTVSHAPGKWIEPR